MIDRHVTPSTAVVVGRAVWGAGLVAVSMFMPPRPGGGGLGIATGLLGVRHLGQAAFSVGHRDEKWRRSGALSDALEAGAMIALAAHPRSSPATRTVSLIEAAITSGFAVSSLRTAQRGKLKFGV